MSLYLFAKGAIKKYHRLSGLDNRNVFSHSSGGWKSKINYGQVWFLLQPPSLVCRWLPSPCLLEWFSCAQIPGALLGVQTSCSCKDTSQIQLGLHFCPHFNLRTTWDPISKHSYVLRYLGLGLQHRNFVEGTQSSSLKMVCFFVIFGSIPWDGCTSLFNHSLTERWLCCL